MYTGIVHNWMMTGFVVFGFLGLVVLIGAVIYGIVSTIGRRLERQRAERIKEYRRKLNEYYNRPL
jgi:hypothetical protein